MTKFVSTFTLSSILNIVLDPDKVHDPYLSNTKYKYQNFSPENLQFLQLQKKKKKKNKNSLLHVRVFVICHYAFQTSMSVWKDPPTVYKSVKTCPEASNVTVTRDSRGQEISVYVS